MKENKGIVAKVIEEEWREELEKEISLKGPLDDAAQREALKHHASQLLTG